MKPNISATGTKGFLSYLKFAQPALYREFKKKVVMPTSGLEGLGLEPLVSSMTLNVATPTLDIADSSSSAPMASSLANTFSDIIKGISTAYLTKQQIDAQSNLMDIQLQRAKQGLAPLNIDPATYGLQPTIGVGLTASTQKLLMYGGIGLLAVMLFGSVLKHGKR